MVPIAVEAAMVPIAVTDPLAATGEPVIHLPRARAAAARAGARPGAGVRSAGARPAGDLRSGAQPAGDRRATGGAPDRHRRLVLDDPRSAAAAAAALGAGAVVGHGFANIYALTTRPDAATVRSVNLLEGRPPGHVGSVTSTPMRIPLLYDWSRLPAQLAVHEALGLMDELLGLGPFGFRGPAAPGVPEHLTRVEGGVRTAQVVAPGHACPSNDFLARALRAAGTDLLHVSSANRSRHRSGATDEPVHWRAAGLREDIGTDPRLVLLEHADDDAARARYPAHRPTSTAILAFHTALPPVGRGRRRLVLERQGSLPVEVVQEVVGDLGFDLALGPHARQRPHQRAYPVAGWPA